MKNYSKGYLNKFLALSLVLLVFLPVGLLTPKQAEATTLIFLDTFGDGNTTSTVAGWNEGGNSGDDAEIRAASSGNDSASPDGGRFAVALGSSGYICRTIDTTGYTNVKLSYYWRGDADSSSSSDDAKVEIKATGTGVTCSSSGWTNLQTHDLRNDSDWTLQTPITNSGMNNKTFLLRFRDDASGDSANHEHFRVDSVALTGDPIAENGQAICSDGQDNDSDGKIDANDPDCAPFVAHLTLVKKVVGGQAAATDWTLSANGPTSVSGVTGNQSVTNVSVLPGAYNLSESVGPTQYIASQWSCAPIVNQGSNPSVTLTTGQSTTCTITNTFDYCPLDEGVQTTGPCKNKDLCSNIDGVQIQIPQGMKVRDGQCVVPTPTEMSCPLPEGNGWYSRYYNYLSTHPDMEVDSSLYNVTHGDPLSKVVAWNTNWYDQSFYRFDRIDSNLEFPLYQFYPFDSSPEELTGGHDYHFGVHSAAKVTALTDGNYGYTLSSDDDAWVYVDGNLVVNNAGIHPTNTINNSIFLTAGEHIVDVFFAERHTIDSTLFFKFNDNSLVIKPYNPTCEQKYETDCNVFSDDQTKVKEIKVALNSPVFPNLNASLVSVVANIQALGSGVWQANVGNPLAKWIWSEDPYDNDWQSDKWVTFEKNFSIGELPSAATLNIAADNSYEVWINKATSSPADLVDPNEDNHSVADSYNVASLLHLGQNTIIAKVKNWALNSESKSNNPGGLLFNLKIENNQCSNDGNENPGEPAKLQVKIYKFLDGVQANGETANSYEFPMTATWSWPGSPLNSANAGTGNYVLGPSGHGGSLPYQAFTAVMNAPAIYQTYEITTSTDENSKVLPVDSQCVDGMYRLKGYRVGNSLSEAQSAEISTAYPDFTNLNADKYVIVENETCPKDEIVINCEEGFHKNSDNQCVADEHSDESNDEQGGGGGSGGIGGHRRTFSANSGGSVLGASTEDSSMCEPYLTEYIKYGAQNNPEEVKKLQTFLNQFFQINIPITGFYGPTTFDWVKKFQDHQKNGVLLPWEAAGLKTDPTGYVYKTTKRWINILKCPETVLTSPLPELK